MPTVTATTVATLLKPATVPSQEGAGNNGAQFEQALSSAQGTNPTVDIAQAKTGAVNAVTKAPPPPNAPPPDPNTGSSGKAANPGPNVQSQKPDSYSNSLNLQTATTVALESLLVTPSVPSGAAASTAASGTKSSSTTSDKSAKPNTASLKTALPVVTNISLQSAAMAAVFVPAQSTPPQISTPPAAASVGGAPTSTEVQVKGSDSTASAEEASAMPLSVTAFRGDPIGFTVPNPSTLGDQNPQGTKNSIPASLTGPLNLGGSGSGIGLETVEALRGSQSPDAQGSTANISGQPRLTLSSGDSSQRKPSQGTSIPETSTQGVASAAKTGTTNASTSNVGSAAAGSGQLFGAPQTSSSTDGRSVTESLVGGQPVSYPTTTTSSVAQAIDTVSQAIPTAITNVAQAVVNVPAASANEVKPDANKGSQNAKGEQGQTVNTTTSVSDVAAKSQSGAGGQGGDDQSHQDAQGSTAQTTPNQTAKSANRTATSVQETQAAPVTTSTSQTTTPVTASQIGTLDAATRLSAVKQVAGQLQVMAATRPQNAVTIQLTPEGLGTVSVTIKGIGKAISAELSASNDGVKAALSEGRNSLTEAMQQRGFTVTELTVRSHVAASQSTAGNSNNGQSRSDQQASSQSQSHQPNTTSSHSGQNFGQNAANGGGNNSGRNTGGGNNSQSRFASEAPTDSSVSTNDLATASLDLSI